MLIFHVFWVWEYATALSDTFQFFLRVDWRWLQEFHIFCGYFILHLSSLLQYPQELFHFSSNTSLSLLHTHACTYKALCIKAHKVQGHTLVTSVRCIPAEMQQIDSVVIWFSADL